MIAGPVYAHGRDKSGRPIVWIRPRLDLEDEEPQAKLMRMVGVLEAVRRVADESGFVLVCDYAGSVSSTDVGLSLSCMRVLFDHFPGLLARAFFLECPTAFWIGWGAIKVFLSAEVESKLQFLTACDDSAGVRVYRELEAEFPPEALEWEYGGSSTYLKASGLDTLRAGSSQQPQADCKDTAKSSWFGWD